jgi:mycofactocin precursor
MSTPQLLADTTETSPEQADELATALVEDVSIDGMCGVY